MSSRNLLLCIGFFGFLLGSNFQGASSSPPGLAKEANDAVDREALPPDPGDAGAAGGSKPDNPEEGGDPVLPDDEKLGINASEEIGVCLGPQRRSRPISQLSELESSQESVNVDEANGTFHGFPLNIDTGQLTPSSTENHAIAQSGAGQTPGQSNAASVFEQEPLQNEGADSENSIQSLSAKASEKSAGPEFVPNDDDIANSVHPQEDPSDLCEQQQSAAESATAPEDSGGPVTLPENKSVSQDDGTSVVASLPSQSVPSPNSDQLQATTTEDSTAESADNSSASVTDNRSLASSAFPFQTVSQEQTCIAGAAGTLHGLELNSETDHTDLTTPKQIALLPTGAEQTPGDISAEPCLGQELVSENLGAERESNIQSLNQDMSGASTCLEFVSSDDDIVNSVHPQNVPADLTEQQQSEAESATLPEDSDGPEVSPKVLDEDEPVSHSDSMSALESPSLQSVSTPVSYCDSMSALESATQSVPTPVSHSDSMGALESSSLLSVPTLDGEPVQAAEDKPTENIPVSIPEGSSSVSDAFQHASLQLEAPNPSSLHVCPTDGLDSNQLVHTQGHCHYNANEYVDLANERRLRTEAHGQQQPFQDNTDNEASLGQSTSSPQLPSGDASHYMDTFGEGQSPHLMPAYDKDGYVDLDEEWRLQTEAGGQQQQALDNPAEEDGLGAAAGSYPLPSDNDGPHTETVPSSNLVSDCDEGDYVDLAEQRRLCAAAAAQQGSDSTSHEGQNTRQDGSAQLVTPVSSNPAPESSSDGCPHDSGRNGMGGSHNGCVSVQCNAENVISEPLQHDQQEDLDESIDHHAPEQDEGDLISSELCDAVDIGNQSDGDDQHGQQAEPDHFMDVANSETFDDGFSGNNVYGIIQHGEHAELGEFINHDAHQLDGHPESLNDGLNGNNIDGIIQHGQQAELDNFMDHDVHQLDGHPESLDIGDSGNNIDGNIQHGQQAEPDNFMDHHVHQLDGHPESLDIEDSGNNVEGNIQHGEHAELGEFINHDAHQLDGHPESLDDGLNGNNIDGNIQHGQQAEPDNFMDHDVHQLDGHPESLDIGDGGNNIDGNIQHGEQAEPDDFMDHDVHEVDGGHGMQQLLCNHGDIGNHPEDNIQYGQQAEPDDLMDYDLHPTYEGYSLYQQVWGDGDEDNNTETGRQAEQDIHADPPEHQPGQDSCDPQPNGWNRSEAQTNVTDCVGAAARVYQPAESSAMEAESAAGCQRPWNIHPVSDAEESAVVDRSASSENTMEQPAMTCPAPSLPALYGQGAQRMWNLQPQPEESAVMENDIADLPLTSCPSPATGTADLPLTSCPSPATADLPLTSCPLPATADLPLTSCPPPATADLPLTSCPPPATADLPLTSCPPPATADLPLTNCTAPATADLPLASCPPPATADLYPVLYHNSAVSPSPTQVLSADLEPSFEEPITLHHSLTVEPTVDLQSSMDDLRMNIQWLVRFLEILLMEFCNN